MALKKSQLYSSLWKSCDELRGGMDASQYKDYVLTLLFMKYVSDKYGGRNAVIDIPDGGGFVDMVKLKGDKEIGDKINKIIAKFAEANDLKGVVDVADFNDDNKLGVGKEMQDRLTKLIGIFEGLDFRSNRATGDDLLGDAYEYLMRHFATESGKSKGQFYTPAEVSRIMAKVVGVKNATSQEDTIYDPTCGSGSLLLKAADEAPGGRITIYGQENDNATWALARMNMILHGHPTADLWKGNTLAAPHFKNKDGSLRTFNYAVANPPFSAKAWSNGLDPLNDEFDRFRYGVPPAKNGDFAFLLHVVSSLKSKGKGAVIMPHGVLFRGGAEAAIRRKLVSQGLIKGIIGLPANLFFGTGIPACIVIIDKEEAAIRTGVFIIDASKGFIKDGPKNRLREQDIHEIVDVFTRQVELPRYSRLVPLDEVAANDYNLNIPRYIDSSEPEDLQDLDAHLRGGIPNRDLDALGKYWEVFPSLRAELFAPGDRPGYSCAKVATEDIKSTILNHSEFTRFAQRVSAVFKEWSCAHQKLLTDLTVGSHPKQIIDTVSEDLLNRFAQLPLLDRYDLYQRLMDYWHEVMQDDVYLIAVDGWVAAAKSRAVIDDKEKEIKEAPDLIVGRGKYKLDLIPPPLIVARFFSTKQETIDALDAARTAAAAALEEFIEEHSGEEGLLEDAKTDKGSVTKASVKDRLKALLFEPDSDDERAALNQCINLIDAETVANKAGTEAQAELDVLVLNRYGTLTENEIRTLTVEDKWLAAIQTAIDGEVQRLTQGLTTRVKTLEERYDHALPELASTMHELSDRVEEHLKTMGLVVA